MSKFCFNCGNVIDDSAIFCPGCGTKQLPPADTNQNFAETAPLDATVIADSEPASFSLDETMVAPAVNSEPVFAPVQPPFSPVQPPEQQYYQPPVAPPEPPKKNKTAVTVAVCAVILCVTLIAAFAVLAITGTISFGKDKKDDKETTESISEVVGDTDEKTTESITERTYGYNIENNGNTVAPTEAPTYINPNNPIDSRVPYTKGQVKNGEYINEWAGFKFKITSDYPETDTATYNSLNAQLPSGEYGFIAINQTAGNTLAISYETNTVPNSTVEEILESSIELAKSMLESYNPITYSNIDTLTLCGEEYVYTTMYYSVSQMYGITLMRIIDGKIVSIVITGQTLSQCYSFLNTFETAYPSM